MADDERPAEIEAAVLSRVSPSRDGTVAVEDVARWLRERFPSGTTMMAADRKHGDVKQTKGEYVAERFLADFSPASTGDREEKA